ncbi:MAG TPA: winged helix-turn-helix domain-containing protein [Methylomirabilota bacterium]|nr:winged helix-turn-helix domain-containing protein [Methylomirabilota bacterium]
MLHATAAGERLDGPFRLGVWTVYPDRNELVRDGDVRRLEGRAMNLLVVLAEHSGRVVTKNELVDAVWEQRIISDGSLTTAVADLRRALDDDARAPRFIVTVPKRGYRLVVPVEPVSASRPAAVSARPSRRWRRVAVLAATAAAVAAAAVAVLSNKAPAPDPERVLVLPLVNRTGDPEMERLTLLARDRIVQEAIAAGVGRFTSGENRVLTDSDAARLARKDGAGLVLTGSIHQSDGLPEIQIRLVEPEARELLFAVPPIVVSSTEAAALDELTQRTLGAVATHLHSHAHARLLTHPPPFAAYREFMAGNQYFGTDFGRSIEHLRRAVEIEPRYTSAWLRLATAYRNTGRHPEAKAIFEQLESRRQELNPFEQLAVDLVAYNPTDPQRAYSAAQEIDRMVPDDPMIGYLAGMLAIRLNRPREALGWMDRLDEDAPSFLTRNVMWSQTYWLRALAHHIIGDFAGELDAARAGLERFPNVLELRSAEARALAAMGDAEGVERAVDAALATPAVTGSAGWVMIHGAASARAHGHQELATDLARKAVRWFREADERFGGVEFGLGEALFHAGELEQSRRVFEAGVDRLPPEIGHETIAAWGWLGAVAARQGDLGRASELDEALSGVDGPTLRHVALFYRVGIAAWGGDRREAVRRLQAACASGWNSYSSLHNLERILLEPVADEPVVSRLLSPSD